MTTIPNGWMAERASGWWSLHHLVHTPCGWRSWLAYDLVIDDAKVKLVVTEHTCPDAQDDEVIVDWDASDDDPDAVGFDDFAVQGSDYSDYSDPAVRAAVAGVVRAESARAAQDGGEGRG